MPDQGMLAVLVVIFGFAAGVGAGILRELLSAGFRSTGEVEGRLGIPVLGALPRLKGTKVPLADLLLADNTSMYAEALRSARTSIVGLRSADAPRVVAITSALPGEGKSTMALALARISAFANVPTLLVECDLRHMSQGKAAGREVTVGLVEVLNGKATVDQAIVGDTVPNLDLLLVSSALFTPEDLFGGDKFAAMLQGLRTRYELIILDLPPVLGLADARSAAIQADAVVLAIRWSDTAPSAVEKALTALRGDGAKVSGAIMTLVDPRSEAIGGYYYSAKYATYYSKPEAA